tara:strand:+ start:358 stop:1068 length:711 start_codon:yes stop_codon:yes gene_type:complete
MRKVQRELDPELVIQKMIEFRQDEGVFYKKYGGGPSVGYDLIDDQGRKYPPAAIVQAALDWEDVKGGVKARDSAGRALKMHGFRVVKKGVRLKSMPSNRDSLLKRLRRIEQTEQSRNGKVRIGTRALREFALRHKICCEVTGINDDPLLRVSHIVPWSRDEKNRLNPENIILLSAHWDAAFDRGLVSFDDEGAALYSSELSKHAISILKSSEDTTLSLTEERTRFLAKHRIKFGYK